VHFWIKLPLFVLCRAGYCNQGRINDGGFVHRHPAFNEVGFDDLENLLAQILVLQQVAEVQNNGLIRDAITDQLDGGKAAQGWRLNQGLFQ